MSNDASIVSFDSMTQTFQDHHDRSWIFSDDEAIKQLPNIERIIKGLSSLPTNERSLDDEFYEDHVRFGALKGQPLFRIRKDSRFEQMREIAKVLLQLRKYNYELSHHAHAFLNYFSWCVMEGLWGEGITFNRVEAEDVILKLQVSIEKLNNKTKSIAFKSKVKNTKEIRTQRVKSLKRWIRYAFRHSSELLMIHLQVGRVINRAIDIEIAINDKNAFLKERRSNPLFRYLVGYIFKMNFHPQKGIVHDMLLFYDANMVREASSLRQGLEELWLKVTFDVELGRTLGSVWKESERLYIARSKKEQVQTLPYRQHVLSHHDEQDKKKIDDIILYLSHYDTYLSYHLPRNTRTLGKSEFKTRTKKQNKQKASSC